MPHTDPTGEEVTLEPEPLPMPECDENGVDRAQIRRLLALSPAERMRTHDLFMNSVVVLDFEGRQLRVLGLRELIAIKKRAGRPKDLAVIPYLESTLNEIEKQRG